MTSFQQDSIHLTARSSSIDARPLILRNRDLILGRKRLVLGIKHLVLGNRHLIPGNRDLTPKPPNRLRDLSLVVLAQRPLFVLHRPPRADRVRVHVRVPFQEAPQLRDVQPGHVAAGSVQLATQREFPEVSIASSKPRALGRRNKVSGAAKEI